MVLLKNKFYLFFLLYLTINTSIIAYQTTIPTETINKKVESLNSKIFDLEINYEMGMDGFEIKSQANDIKNQLLYHKYQIGTDKEKYNEKWTKSEQMILNAKLKLQALQNKLQAEGDWGAVKLRMQGLNGKDPGTVKVRYKYGF